MFGVNSIVGIVQWLGVPDLLRTDGPPWTDNLLAPSPSWGDGGTTTNRNWVIQTGGPYESVSVPWSGLVRVMPAYVCRIPENMRSAARRVCDDLLRYNCTYHIQSISTCRNPIRVRLTNQRDDNWDELVSQ